MTRLSLTLDDIGEGIRWPDLRDFCTYTQMDRDSALFKSQNPETWWWRTEYDFWADISHSLRIIVWQNADPKKRGQFPERIARPKKRKPEPTTPEQLEAHKAKLRR